MAKKKAKKRSTSNRKKAAKSNSLGVGARLLIMIYAGSMVLIGSYSIRQEFGSVYAFLSGKVSDIFTDGSLMESDRASRRSTEESLANSLSDSSQVTTFGSTHSEELEQHRERDRAALKRFLSEQ